MNKFLLRIAYKLFGRLVGRDKLGNEYFESKLGKREFMRGKRAVLYRGISEPSKIEPAWYNWLHYVTDEVPLSDTVGRQWELERAPNLTGTVHAHYPSGHFLGEGQRKKAIGDYESWRP